MALELISTGLSHGGRNTAMKWDDLRYFLAVVRTHSVRAAAEQLQVNHATVARRIDALENQQQTTLFDRTPQGYQLTPAGEAILPQAVQIEKSFTTMEQRLRGLNLHTGVVLVSVSDGMVAPLAPLLATFQRAHPEIQVNLMIANTNIGFTAEQAHLAIRFVKSPPEELVGRRVGTLPSAVYASRDYLEHAGQEKSLKDYQWIGWDESWDHLPAAQWLRENVAREQIVCRVNSSLAMIEAVNAGMGVAHLLCLEADLRHELVKLGEEHRDESTNLWLITHPELRKLPRVQTLMNFLVENIREVYLHQCASKLSEQESS